MADARVRAVVPDADGRLWFAHALRGIAAVVVLVEHLLISNWLMADQHAALLGTAPLPADPSGLVHLPAFAWLADHGLVFGTVAVAIFFMISGLVIPLSVERLRPGRFAWARALRLYPVWWASLGVGGLCLVLYWAATGADSPAGLGAWMMNATLLHDWFGVGAVNPVVWTLVIELKFYVICGVIGALFGLHRAAPFVVAMAGLAVVAGLAQGWIDALAASGNGELVWVVSTVAFDSPFLIFMFLGVCLHNLRTGRWSGRRTALVSAILWSLVGVAAMLGPAPWVWQRQVLVALVVGYAVFVACLMGLITLPRRPLLGWLADISYPLYAVHYPLAGVVLAVVWTTTGSPWVAIAVAVALSLVAAAAIHWAVERPAIALGRWRPRTAAVATVADPAPVSATAEVVSEG